jgi:hypothetical protein
MEEEQEDRPRPKIVDKRISAGGHVGKRRETPREGSATSPPAPDRFESPSGDAAAAPASSDAPTEPDSKRLGGRGSVAPTPSEAPEGGAPLRRGEQVWTPEQEAEARRIVDEIARTPSLEWVLQSAVNLANVAGTKIETGAVEDASLAIDALAALINGLPGKLGDAETPLRQTLAQLQLAYSQRAAPGPMGETPAT